MRILKHEDWQHQDIFIPANLTKSITHAVPYNLDLY